MQAHLELFITDTTIPLHYRSRFNDRDENSTRALYKKRMKERGYAQHGRSKMIVGPWEDDSRAAPNAASCEIYAACHCYEALCEAFIEDCDNPQLKIAIENGLRDVIMLKPHVPEVWKRKIVVMLNENNTGSGFGIQQCVNLRLRHARNFQLHMNALNTSVSKLGGQAQYELFHKTWLKDEAKCDVYVEWEYYRHMGVWLGNMAACTTTFRLSDLVEGQWPTDSLLAKFMEMVRLEVCNTTASESLISLEHILRNCCELDKAIRVHYKHSISPAHFTIMWTEAMKCCLPTILDGHKKCFSVYSPAEVALVHTKMDGTKQVQLHFNAKGAAKKAAAKPKPKGKRKEEGKAKAEAKRRNKTRGNNGQHEESEVAEDVKEEQDVKETQPEQSKVINCEQDIEKLKLMEWGEDMVWVLDNASQVLVARGYDVSTHLLSEEEVAWRAGYHLIFTKTCKYYKAKAPTDSTAANGDGELLEYTKWPELKKAIFTRIAAKSVEFVKTRLVFFIMCSTRHTCALSVFVCTCVLTNVDFICNRK